MKLLLDTHTALWLFNEHEKLSSNARDSILDEKNVLYISIVSAWEIAIKNSLGKLGEFKGGTKVFLAAVNNSPIELLPVKREHVLLVETLPFIHRDPFDRMLIATAVSEHMSIVTTDENIKKYDVSIVW